MTLVLGDVINSVRNKNPDFAKQRCPDITLASFFTDYQRELVSMALERVPEFIVAQLSIVFPPIGSNALNPLASIGAGTGNGLPAQLDPTTGGIDAITQVVGNTVNLDVPSAVIEFGPAVVSAATQTTIPPVGAPGWTTNPWAGFAVANQLGTDNGDVQTIASNTSTTLTLEGAGFQLVPDTTSTFTILDLTPTVDDTTGAVIGWPQIGSRLT